MCSSIHHFDQLSDWVACTSDFNCAKICVENYMQMFGPECTGKMSKDVSR